MTVMTKVDMAPQTKPEAAFLPSQMRGRQELSQVKKLTNRGNSLSISPPLIQPKLIIGEVDDPYEREADHVADTIMRMPQTHGVKPQTLQRTFINTKTIGEVPSSVHEVLNTTGRPLDSNTRAYMEPHFGYDFSKVRIHTDAKAAASARAINALAYTVGSDVVFNRGRYAPGTSEGKKLLGHELAHVVQQGSRRKNSTNIVQRQESKTPEKNESCNVKDIFTELDPGPFLPSAYFRNGTTIYEKGDFKTQLKTAWKGNCNVEANFEDIELEWDLGNPKLGKWWGLNINKSSLTINMNNKIIYNRIPPCVCFIGTLGWSFNVDAKKVFDKGKPDERTETGKTSAPLTGSKKTGECKGEKCCSISKTFTISSWLGDDDVDINIKGDITLEGNMYLY